MQKTNLRDSLMAGDITIGSWIQLAQPANAEILAQAGFDWLTIDLEHSVISLREAEELIRIVDLCGVTPLVRISSNNPVQISRIMDAGSHGIIVPMVNTKAQAETAVEAVFYPPVGSRGVGLARCHAYGARFEYYQQWLPDNGTIIVQIENIKAIENLREIFSVDRIHGFIVGPYDLSASLGIAGQLSHPSMIEALAEINRIADEFPVIAKGVHKVGIEPEPVLEAVRNGYRLIAYSTDMLFLGESCRNGMETIKAAIEDT